MLLCLVFLLGGCDPSGGYTGLSSTSGSNATTTTSSQQELPEFYVVNGQKIPSITKVVGARTLTSSDADAADADFGSVSYSYTSPNPVDDLLQYTSYLTENCQATLLTNFDGSKRTVGKLKLSFVSTVAQTNLTMYILFDTIGYEIRLERSSTTTTPKR